MPAGRIHIAAPDSLADFVGAGCLHTALGEIAGLADADLSLGRADAAPDAACDRELAVCYREVPVGCVRVPMAAGAAVERAGRAVAGLFEHLVERESAISDLAEQMITGFEELNILYSLLPNIATKVHAPAIGEMVVEETARVLNCDRVSLLVLDEQGQRLNVLASHGLPRDIDQVSIPIGRSVAGQVLLGDDMLVVNDMDQRPDLSELSSGTYESDSFAVVRVPLRARGEAVGVLTATERRGVAEFTARDHKLLGALSAVGASALLSCRLHAAVTRQMMSTIRALASAVDAKDHYTHDHSSRVAQLCVATARELGLKDAQTRHEVELAGLLHDIGKIGIPDAILSKTARLTTEEFAIIKTHAEIGARIVEHVDGLQNVAKAVLYHHERWDGLGYPGGLASEDIPLISRLIGVADAFDCLTSDRPYREASSFKAALRELIACRGTHFDPHAVDAFVNVIRRERG